LKLIGQRQKERLQNRENQLNGLALKRYRLLPHDPQCTPQDDRERAKPNATVVNTQQKSKTQASREHQKALQQYVSSSDPDHLMFSPVETHEINAHEMLSRSVAPASGFSNVDLSSLDNNPSYGAATSQDSYLALTGDEAQPSRGLSASKVFYPSARKQTSCAMILCFPDWPGSMDASDLSRDTLLEEDTISTPICASDKTQNLDVYLDGNAHQSSEGIQERATPPNQTPNIDFFISAVTRFLQTHHSLPSPSIPPLPSPYQNNLECPLSTILSAYFHNANAIGLSLADILSNSSPFSRPNTSMSDDPQAILSEVRAQRPWIPSHLQPTLPQVLFAHHHYVDLLPFPGLRARAILMGLGGGMGTDVGMRLKLDVFSYGICCFRDGERGGSGQPWDGKSWVVRGWFRKKWRLLID
jgi:hypothetical protein